MSNSLVGRPMEILMVEDNRADARLAIEALQDGRIKHRLTLIFDGEEALEFLHQVGRFARAPRPDLILLDLGLPRLDGREVLERVKHDDDLKQIPVVILTASKDHEDYLRGQLHDVEAYMVKPVDVEKFIDVVRVLKKYWHSDVILPTA